MPSEIRKNPNGRPFCSWACYRPSSPPLLSEDGQTAAIPLYGADGNIRAHAIVDVADAEWASQWRWVLLGGYAGRNEQSERRGHPVYLHRELLGLPRKSDGREGDHIDRNKLNDRRGNLRVLTRPQNAQNHPGFGGRSAYRGVDFYKRDGKWRARITVNGKGIQIGLYDDELEAAMAVRAARARLMPYSPD